MEEHSGMVAVVRGLRDAGLAVTLLDSGNQYTLVSKYNANHQAEAAGGKSPPQRESRPPSPLQRCTVHVPQYRAPQSHSEPCCHYTPPPVAVSRSAGTDRGEHSSRDRSAQATDGRYASVYQTTLCKKTPTSPPIDVSEFPPQRTVPPGCDNFVVGGTGSGDTHATPARGNNYRVGPGWTGKGPVPLPSRLSQASDAFASSLRRYPAMSPERSAEILERLITYTQGKNLGRSSRSSRGTACADASLRTSPARSPTRSFDDPLRARREGSPVSERRRPDPPAREARREKPKEGRSINCYVPHHMVPNTREDWYERIAEAATEPWTPTPSTTPPGKVDTEIQVTTTTFCRDNCTSPRLDRPPIKRNVAVSTSAVFDKLQHPTEGGVSPKSCPKTSTVSLNTITPVTIKKSAQTTFSSVDITSKKFDTGISRRSKSEVSIKDMCSDVIQCCGEITRKNSEVRSLCKNVCEKLLKLKNSNSITDNRKLIVYNKETDTITDNRILLDPYTLDKFKHNYNTTIYRAEVSSCMDPDQYIVIREWFKRIPIKFKRSSNSIKDFEDTVASFVHRVRNICGASKTDFRKVKTETCKILNELPIDVAKSCSKHNIVNKLADDLIDKLQHLNTTHNTKDIASVSKRESCLKGNIQPTVKEMKTFVTEEINGFKEQFRSSIDSERVHKLENDLLDILIDSVPETNDNNENVVEEITMLLRDSGGLFEQQAKFLANILVEHLREMLHNKNAYNTMSTLLSSEDLIANAIEKEIPSDSESFVHKLTDQIEEWLSDIPVAIPVPQDERFRQSAIKELANDIIDRHRYLEMNGTPASDKAELENLKYQIFKWINKLDGDVHLEALEFASQLLERIWNVLDPSHVASKDDISENKPSIDMPKHEREDKINHHLAQYMDHCTNYRDDFPTSTTGSMVSSPAIPTTSVTTQIKSVGINASTGYGSMSAYWRPCCVMLSGTQTSNVGACCDNRALTVDQINNEYDIYLRDWVNRIPISANSPQEKAMVDSMRKGFYNGVWKVLTKLKCQPRLLLNPFHYQDALDQELEELFSMLPENDELAANKHRLKVEMIEKTSDANEKIKMIYAPETFKKDLANKIEEYVPKLTTDNRDEDADKVIEDIKAMDLADNFILYTRYKEDDPIKANVYKNKLLVRTHEFVKELKAKYGTKWKDINEANYANDIINALHQVPLPEEDTIRNEANAILLAMEVEQWYTDLPIAVNEDRVEQLKRRRLKDALAKKLYDMEKTMDFADSGVDRVLRHEVSQFLEKLPLVRDESLNINFMVDQLANRLKNRPKENLTVERERSVSFQDTVNYDNFTKNVVASSSYANTNQANPMATSTPNSKQPPYGFNTDMASCPQCAQNNILPQMSGFDNITPILDQPYGSSQNATQGPLLGAPYMQNIVPLENDLRVQQFLPSQQGPGEYVGVTGTGIILPVDGFAAVPSGLQPVVQTQTQNVIRQNNALNDFSTGQDVKSHRVIEESVCRKTIQTISQSGNDGVGMGAPIGLADVPKSSPQVGQGQDPGPSAYQAVGSGPLVGGASGQPSTRNVEDIVSGQGVISTAQYNAQGRDTIHTMSIIEDSVIRKTISHTTSDSRKSGMSYVTGTGQADISLSPESRFDKSNVRPGVARSTGRGVCPNNCSAIRRSIGGTERKCTKPTTGKCSCKIFNVFGAAQNAESEGAQGAPQTNLEGQARQNAVAGASRQGGSEAQSNVQGQDTVRTMSIYDESTNMSVNHTVSRPQDSVGIEDVSNTSPDSNNKSLKPDEVFIAGQGAWQQGGPVGSVAIASQIENVMGQGQIPEPSTGEGTESGPANAAVQVGGTGVYQDLVQDTGSCQSRAGKEIGPECHGTQCMKSVTGKCSCPTQAATSSQGAESGIQGSPALEVSPGTTSEPSNAAVQDRDIEVGQHSVQGTAAGISQVADSGIHQGGSSAWQSGKQGATGSEASPSQGGTPSEQTQGGKYADAIQGGKPELLQGASPEARQGYATDTRQVTDAGAVAGPVLCECGQYHGRPPKSGQPEECPRYVINRSSSPINTIMCGDPRPRQGTCVFPNASKGPVRYPNLGNKYPRMAQAHGMGNVYEPCSNMPQGADTLSDTYQANVSRQRMCHSSGICRNMSMTTRGSPGVCPYVPSGPGIKSDAAQGVCPSKSQKHRSRPSKTGEPCLYVSQGTTACTEPSGENSEICQANISIQVTPKLKGAIVMAHGQSTSYGTQVPSQCIDGQIRCVDDPEVPSVKLEDYYLPTKTIFQSPAYNVTTVNAALVDCPFQYNNTVHKSQSMDSILVKNNLSCDVKKSKSQTFKTENSQENTLDDDKQEILYGEWSEKLRKLRKKLEKPGGEDKVRKKIQKFLDKVPNNLCNSDSCSKKLREELPETIIFKLKNMCLRCEDDLQDNVRYNSYNESDNKSSLSIISDETPNDDYKMHRQQIAESRETPDSKSNNACRSNHGELKQTSIHRNNHTDISQQNSNPSCGQENDTKLRGSSLSLRNHCNCYTNKLNRMRVKELRDFVIDEVMGFLKSVEHRISRKRMLVLEMELAELFSECMDAADFNSDELRKSVKLLLRAVGKLSVKHARHVSKILMERFLTFRNSNEEIVAPSSKKGFLGNPLSETILMMQDSLLWRRNDSFLRWKYGREQKHRSVRPRVDRQITMYVEGIAKQIYEWLQELGVATSGRKTCKKAAINNMAIDITERKKYCQVNALYKCDVAEEMRNLQYLVYKWLRKLIGKQNAFTLANTEKLMYKINKVTEPNFKERVASSNAVSQTCHCDQICQAIQINAEEFGKPHLEQFFQEVLGCSSNELPYSDDRDLGMQLVRNLDTIVNSDIKNNSSHEHEVESWAQKFIQNNVVAHVQSTVRSKVIAEKHDASMQVIVETEQIAVNTEQYDTFIRETTKINNFESYIASIEGVISNWIETLQIEEIKSHPFIKAAIRELACSIFDRHKYLFINSLRIKDEDDLEMLKYQIFKWTSKLIGDNHRQFKTPIDSANKLMRSLQCIPMPNFNQIMEMENATCPNKVQPITKTDMGQSAVMPHDLTKNKLPLFNNKNVDSSKEYKPINTNIRNNMNPRDFNKYENNINRTLFTQDVNVCLSTKNESTNKLPDKVKNMSVAELYERYNRILKNHCEKLPLENTTPEQKNFVDLTMRSVLNDIWKQYFRLKSDPQVDTDDETFITLFGEYLDNVYDHFPTTAAINEFRVPWKRNILSDVLSMHNHVKEKNANSSYKYDLISCLNKEYLEEDPCSQPSDLLQQTTFERVADSFILYSKYRICNKEMAVIYKRKLMAKLLEMVEYMKRRNSVLYGAVNPNQLCEEIFMILNNVPYPKAETLEAEASEIQIDEVLEEWYFELPINQISSVKEDILINKERRQLARKLYRLEEDCFHPSSCQFVNLDLDMNMRQEVQLFLQNYGNLHESAAASLNFMMDQLMYRLKNRQRNFCQSSSLLDLTDDNSVVFAPILEVDNNKSRGVLKTGHVAGPSYCLTCKAQGSYSQPAMLSNMNQQSNSVGQNFSEMCMRNVTMDQYGGPLFRPAEGWSSTGVNPASDELPGCVNCNYQECSNYARYQSQGNFECHCMGHYAERCPRKDRSHVCSYNVYEYNV